MRAAFVDGHPRVTFSRRDRVGNTGQVTTSRGGRRRLLPRLEVLLRMHPSEDRLPFQQRVVHRLVDGGGPW